MQWDTALLTISCTRISAKADIVWRKWYRYSPFCVNAKTVFKTDVIGWQKIGKSGHDGEHVRGV